MAKSTLVQIVAPVLVGLTLVAPAYCVEVLRENSQTNSCYGPRNKKDDSNKGLMNKRDSQRINYTLESVGEIDKCTSEELNSHGLFFGLFNVFFQSKKDELKPVKIQKTQTEYTPGSIKPLEPKRNSYAPASPAPKQERNQNYILPTASKK